MECIRRLMLALALCAAAGTALAAKEAKPPEGVKVAGGAQFDIYVVHKESKPAVGGYALNIYEATIVVHQTPRHGRQLYRSRKEASNADLLDPSMWQLGDFNGDGLDDYRVVAGIGSKGCRIWATQFWLPDRERFTGAGKGPLFTDANGKPVKSCL